MFAKEQLKKLHGHLLVLEALNDLFERVAEWSMTQIMTQASKLYAKNVTLRGRISILRHCVCLELFTEDSSQMSNADGVLKTTVSGCWIHMVRDSELPQSAQSLEFLCVHGVHQ